MFCPTLQFWRKNWNIIHSKRDSKSQFLFEIWTKKFFFVQNLNPKWRFSWISKNQKTNFLWQNAFQSEFACPYHHILSLYFLCNHISHTLLYSHPPLHKDHVAQRDLQYITISSVMTSFWLLLWIQNWDETALILFYNCAPISLLIIDHHFETVLQSSVI